MNIMLSLVLVMSCSAVTALGIFLLLCATDDSPKSAQIENDLTLFGFIFLIFGLTILSLFLKIPI
jgi:hypothetical protein